MSAVARQLRALIPQAEGNPLAMVGIARQLSGQDLEEEALALAERALALSEPGSEPYILARELLSCGVPRWHFIIVRDRARNQAYEAALRRAIRPGCKVLEIGTGTGLLAMMAARAGAASVVTCEMKPAVARAAREVIAANGLADRITVVTGHSSSLTAADIGGRADILVSEIVSNDLLGEGALPAHAHALAELLKPDAIVIPPRGRVRIALAEVVGANAGLMSEAEGFDLSPFNRLAPTFRELHVESEAIRLRSAPADAFAFDFSRPSLQHGRNRVSLQSTGGTVSGVIQWISLDFNEAESYENQPGPGARSCWSSMFWPFERSVETAPGDLIEVAGSHTADRIRFWLGRYTT